MTSTTDDLDLGISYSEVADRPSFNHNPVSWEGDWDGKVARGSEMFVDKTEHPRLAFTFTNCKFLDVGRATELEDGQSFVLMIKPLSEESAKKPKSLTQLGLTVKASGKDLTAANFAGRVRVTEITETYKKSNGYDGYTYHWKFEKIGEAGNVSNGASADKDAKFAQAEEAARLALESTTWESESAFRTAWLNNPAVNDISADFNTEVMTGRWKGFKNPGIPAA